MDLIVQQIVSVDMNPERAEAFLRFCKHEAFYGQLGAELINSKPEDIINGRISLFIKNGQWQRTQIIDEKGKL